MPPDGRARSSLALLACLGLLACKSAGGTVGNAILATAFASGAALAYRGAGGCLAECVYGTFCNTATGNCERLPCGGCGPGEYCANAGGGEMRCQTVVLPQDARAPARTNTPPVRSVTYSAHLLTMDELGGAPPQPDGGSR